MKETLEIQNSLAAPLILILTFFLQIAPVFLSYLKEKRGSWNAKEIELKQQIKELLKEAAPLSNPSTFAQAALLRRKAAAKEKELEQCQELHKQKNHYDMCLKALSVLKVIAYPLLILWFWRNPVAVVPQQLVQPLGRIFSWRTLDPVSSHIMPCQQVYLSEDHQVGECNLLAVPVRCSNRTKVKNASPWTWIEDVRRSFDCQMYRIMYNSTSLQDKGNKTFSVKTSYVDLIGISINSDPSERSFVPSMEEIWAMVVKMGSFTSPGPDGYPPVFYKSVGLLFVLMCLDQ
ncbi:hypothetical protein C5167_015876 [Papaver somniferum]|nr:hypothetical protein C5167_015876 [Papaver somniferum]